MVARDPDCRVQIIGDEAAQRLGVIARIGNDMANTRDMGRKLA